MTIKELKEKIESMPDDLEIFVRNTVNPCGNIFPLDSLKKNTYGFFGKSIDCIIFQNDDYSQNKS